MDKSAYSQLPQLAKSATQARLTDSKTDRSFTFLVNPETLDFDYSQERSLLNVLGTDAGVSRWKYSQHKLTLPDVKLWTPANDRDLTEPLDMLTGWTKADPPVLKFSWGSLGLDACYLQSFSYRITQIRTGRPTKAVGQMELIPAPAIFEPYQDSPEETKTELTPKERAEYRAILEDTFTDYADDEIVLKPDGSVYLKGELLPQTIFEIEASLRAVNS